MMRRFGIALLFALLASMPAAQARHARGSAASSVAMTNYVGVNLNALSYYTPEQPFLNVFKQGGSNTYYEGWYTSKSGTTETNEEAYLQLDSDGYPTSLVAGNGFSGTQQFTYVQTFINFGLGTPAGASVPYPGGSYTLEFEGQGTVVLGFDVTSGSLSTSSPNCSASGLTITSTMTSGQTCIVTFTVTTPDTGIDFEITALPSSTNYIRDVSIVQTAYESAYQAGELFSPLFKAMLTNSGNGGYRRLRFMWWNQTVQQEWRINFTASLSNGATSGTLASVTSYNSGNLSPWPFPSGTYTFVFATGQTIEVNCTYGSTALTWSTPLSAAIPTNAPGSMAMFLQHGSWSQRPLLSNAFWEPWNGIPYEAAIQLCNEVNADCWVNMPMGAVYADNTYATNMAELLDTGANAVLTNSVVSSFAGLNSNLKAYIEDSNEVWNEGSGYGGAFFALMMGGLQYPQSGNEVFEQQEWMGVQQAGISDAFYAQYGSTAFANRVVTLMCQQFAAGAISQMEYAMNTPDWTSKAYTHHIGGICYAPYFNLEGVSADDATAIVATSNPLDTFFALAYSNTYGGNTYSSLPADGYLGVLSDTCTNTGPPYCSTITTEKAVIASNAGQAWDTLPVYGYESGDSFQTNGTPAFGVAGWLSLIESAVVDPRMAYIYDDPAHQLSSNPGYLPASVSAGFANLNHFEDVSGYGDYGTWGALENVTQTISPLSNAPPKYQGIMDYVIQ